MYAGNAFADRVGRDATKVVTVRTTDFTPAAERRRGGVEKVARRGRCRRRRIRRVRGPEERSPRARPRRGSSSPAAARWGAARTSRDARAARRRARRRDGRLARGGRRGLRAERLAGRPDRQGRRARPLHRRRHLRRHPAPRRHEGLARPSSPSTRTRRRRSSRSPTTASSATCSRCSRSSSGSSKTPPRGGAIHVDNHDCPAGGCPHERRDHRRQGLRRRPARPHRRAPSPRLAEAAGVTPGLAVVLVGDDPASEVYVRNKGKHDPRGRHALRARLPAATHRGELLALIDRLNRDPTRPRHPGPAAAAGADRRSTGARRGRPGQGRRRLPRR